MMYLSRSRYLLFTCCVIRRVLTVTVRQTSLLPPSSRMDSNNPTSLFFDEEEVDLYVVLSVEHTASQEDIKKAYRKLALIYHPDKHATAAEGAKLAASRKFQQVGFAYTVLSEEKRRAKYDATGSTEEGFELADGEDGWQAYFEALFESVTREKLDQMKKEYQGMVLLRSLRYD